MKANPIKWQIGSILMGALVVLSACKGNKSDGLDYLAVRFDSSDSWSIIDKDGRIVVYEEYPADTYLSTIVDGVYWVYSNGKYQLYNLDNPKIPVNDQEYTRATPFRNGVAVVSNPNEPIRIIAKDGSTIATLSKDIVECNYFNSDGLGRIMNSKGKYGVINDKGQVLISPKYNSLSIGTDGVILTYNDDDKLVVIDKNEKKLGEISLKTYSIVTGVFCEDKIIVTKCDDKEGVYFVLDKAGNELFEISKAKYGNDSYVDGYLAFGGSDGKYGVVDDKGNTVIRPKYEYINNIGNGQFSVLKNSKWGVVDNQDNIVIDFMYDAWSLRLGNNYILYSDDSFRMVNKAQKEIASFSDYSLFYSTTAEYVNTKDLAVKVYNSIAPFENGMTAKQLANRESLDANDFKWDFKINSFMSIDGKVSVLLSSTYENRLTKEVTHQETEDDGWFAHTYTVSDGWVWKDDYPSSISGTITVDDSSLSLKDIYYALVEMVPDGHNMVAEGVYTTGKCTTRFTLEDSYIRIDITF